MKKLLGIVVLGLLLSSNAFAESEKLKTWGKNSQIPEEYYHPNLKTLRYHFLKYNKRGESSKKFYTKPSSQPSSLKFNLQKEPKIIKKIVKKMQSTGLISYLMYEDGEIVIDQLSPPERFGDLIDNDTMIYSMSLGKSLGGYLMGHAICKGYINSLSSSLADWPIVKGTLLETATVQDVINASTGDQKYIKNNL